MDMRAFLPADILLPKKMPLDRWAVIACDQFTSDPAYWQRVRRYAAGWPSTIELILPEAELGKVQPQTVASINSAMDRYLRQDLFQSYSDAYIYVERTLENGMVRRGIIGMVDLEEYDYHPGSTSLIRATEMTVLERIPPRKMVRSGASMELPHVLMLCDDDQRLLIEPVSLLRDRLPLLYDFDLMEDGGHIRGWLLQGDSARAFSDRMDAYSRSFEEKYPDLPQPKVLLAVGDGNHSLATAKSCYEELKAAHPGEDMSRHPARYALVELENIHDPAQKFEPIHRVITDTDPEKLLKDLEAVCAADGYQVDFVVGEKRGTVILDRRKGELAVAVLQAFLDRWLAENPGKIDYIHGDRELEALSKAPNAIGFLLPPMEKSQLFRGVISGGSLPRKTFSMGHAREKRYYLEGRKIR